MCERESPCMNGGTCEDLEYDFNCICPEYSFGKRCEGKLLSQVLNIFKFLSVSLNHLKKSYAFLLQ